VALSHWRSCDALPITALCVSGEASRSWDDCTQTSSHSITRSR
jgi:hypothetical protein